MKKQFYDFRHVLQRRRVVFQVSLRDGFEDAGVAANGDDLLYLKGNRIEHGGAQDGAAAGRVADKKGLADTEDFQQPFDMSDAVPAGSEKL